MGDSLSTAKNKATTIMRCLVLIGSLLACSSASPFDAGYGAPIAPVVTAPAPVVHSIPAPVAPVPLQLVHNAPIVHSVPQPVVHSVPAPIAAPLPVVAPAPVASPLPLSAPVQVAAPVPFAAPVPVAPVVEPPSSQFHAQDEFGQFSFGYQNINSAKSETRDAFGVTRGSYQYVDANGVLQTVNYIADPVNGFRVAGTNIPVAPEVAPVAAPVAPIAPAAAPLVAPVAPVETPEVAAARAEHLAAHAEATAAAADATSSIEKREAEPIDGDYEIPAAPVLRLPVPLVQNVPAPVINHVIHTAPVVQSIPAPAPVAAPLPTVFNDFRNFVPVNQVFAPEQFTFVAAPSTLPQAVPAPLAAPAPVPAPLPVAAPAPLPLAAPVPLAAPAPVAPIVEPPSSQFHAQDEFGQFSFGYQNINSAKTESRDAFGVTRGSYQYVDANGILQTVNYIADPVNGFRVAGTNIPVAPEVAPVAAPVAPIAPVAAPLEAPVAPAETPEVAAARAEHLAAHEKAKAEAAAVEAEN